MNNLITELRMLLAEKLLGWAFDIAPLNTEGQKLTKFITRYYMEIIKDNPSANLAYKLIKKEKKEEVPVTNLETKCRHGVHFTIQCSKCLDNAGDSKTWSQAITGIPKEYLGHDKKLVGVKAMEITTQRYCIECLHRRVKPGLEPCHGCMGFAGKPNWERKIK